MAYNKYVYNKINWKNKSESLETPLGKTNLNHMDDGIYQIAEKIDVFYNELSTGKFDKQYANKVISEMPTWDSDSGILKIKFYDGTEFLIDFNIEKIPVSFSMDSSGVITMATADGTEWTANIGDVIPDYTFTDSDRIAFSKSKNSDGSYSVSADLKKNSITDEYLQPNYLADITTQASIALSSAQSAQESADNAAFDAKLAQSYSVGGSGVREGEDEDNAKYYSGQAQASAQSADNDAQTAKEKAEEATKQAANALQSANNAKLSENNAKTSEGNALQSETNAKASEEIASASESVATQKAKEASDSADLSKSWAVGDTGVREGENTDNSKYYAGQSKNSRDQAEQFAKDSQSAVDEIDKKLGFADFEIDDEGNLIYTDDSAYDFSVEEDGNLYWEVA